ncbi:MAG: hypothetical protein EXX96DRAFT_447771, partial [Benjaminiella poitrasii]
ESNLNTLPTPSSCIYGLLSVGVHNESDGKGMKRKLKIGSKTMNVLITLSVHLQKDSSEAAVDIGPESSSTPLTVDPRTARILYRSDRIKEYIETIKNSSMSYAPQKTLTSLRQLVSEFDNPSTFFYARASHEEFEVDQLMPATIFTISLAVSVINQLPIDFSSALDDFSNVKLMKGSQSSTSLAWKNLSAFVDSLAINLNEERLPSPGVLAKKVNFSTVAVDACQTVTLANRKIKKDVHPRLQNLY